MVSWRIFGSGLIHLIIRCYPINQPGSNEPLFWTGLVGRRRSGSFTPHRPMSQLLVVSSVKMYRPRPTRSRRPSRSGTENWPEIEFTDDRNGCLFTATVHRTVTASEIGYKESTTSASNTEVTTEVGRVLALLERPQTRKELQTALGLKNDEHFRKSYLVPAPAAGVIEMTHPEKPTSSKQRYRRTKTGNAWIASKGDRS